MRGKLRLALILALLIVFLALILTSGDKPGLLGRYGIPRPEQP